MEGYQTLRQLGFGLLDMNYHTKVGELENKSVKSLRMNIQKQHSYILRILKRR
jgi:peptidyl-dipeptidase Dcp